MFRLDRSNRASILLDSLRAAAAQAVCLGHAWRFATHDHAGAVACQSIAVDVFFILSGFLIARVLLTNEKDGLAAYAAARFARIYSALVPALFAVAAIDVTLVIAGLHGTPQYVTFNAWLKTLLALNNYTGFASAHLQSPTFGSAGPLWTLAIEIHIYAFVGILFFIVRRPLRYIWLLPAAFFFGQVPVSYLSGSPIGIGQGLFALWLAGAVIGRWLPAATSPWCRTIAFLALIISVAMYLAEIAPGREYDVRLYPLLAIAFAGAVSFAASIPAAAEGRPATILRFMAAYSLTLYLTHYTVLYALWRLHFSGAALFLIGVVVANVIAMALAIPMEMKHRALARLLTRRWRCFTCETSPRRLSPGSMDGVAQPVDRDVLAVEGLDARGK